MLQFSMTVERKHFDENYFTVQRKAPLLFTTKSQCHFRRTYFMVTTIHIELSFKSAESLKMFRISNQYSMVFAWYVQLIQLAGQLTMYLAFYSMYVHFTSSCFTTHASCALLWLRSDAAVMILFHICVWCRQ